MSELSLTKKLVAEAVGTAALLAVVVGSGIMAEALSAGNNGVALLGNTLATGAILFVLITVFGPLSGAHFNPAVTLVFVIRKELPVSHLGPYWIVQTIAAIGGVVLAHLMFDLDIISISTKVRAGSPQILAEAVATFGLILTILGCLSTRPGAVAAAVGLYISAGYWFTSSTSFANPAVTIARCLSDTFAGIAPAYAPGFIVGQLLGALAAWALHKYLWPNAKS